MDGFGIFTFYFIEKKEPLRSGGNHSNFFYAETLAPFFVFHLKGLVQIILKHLSATNKTILTRSYTLIGPCKISEQHAALKNRF